MSGLYWPGFMEHGKRERTLAMLESAEGADCPIDGYKITTEEGEVYRVKSWEDVKQVTCKHKLELYVTDLASAWWFADASIDKQVRIQLPGVPMLRSWSPVTCLSFKKGRQRGWIVSSKAWNTAGVSADFLRALRTLFTECGVGVRPTPGSLGQALMRDQWQTRRRPWVRRPPNQARLDILAHSYGGRVDYYVSKDQVFSEVYEQDLTGAYASVCDRLPDGPCIALHSEPASSLGITTYFMECDLCILDDARLDFGIFAQKKANGTNIYPTEPGRYTAWLWKEEVDECRKNGILVLPSSGWGWTKWNSGLGSWALRMFQLRRSLGASDSALGGWMKQAVVAAIGRFGMPLWQWTLHVEDSSNLQTGDMALMIDNQETGLVMRREEELQSNHLTHWYSYIIMRCRLVLRARMQHEKDRGNQTLASNYDAIYTLLPAEAGSLGAGLGDWKQEKLTRARFPFPRGLLSDQKNSLPGHKEKSQARMKLLGASP